MRILDSLGSTEAFSTYLSNISDVTKPGATGKLVPGFDAVLRDENGRACRNGEPGVLWLRGPSLSTDGTRSDSGWFCTNDVFIRDADGYFFFQGRSDDMFKVAGQWIAPLDIEEVLLRHPAVREAAVVAHDDGQGTLQPKAWVVVDEPSEGLARELQRWCKNELDSRRHPHLIEFVEQLPRTATGKLTRAPLRQTQFAPVVWDELNPVAV